jgi:hypothetical protein
MDINFVFYMFVSTYMCEWFGLFAIVCVYCFRVILSKLCVNILLKAS